MTESSQTLPESWLVRPESCLRVQQDRYAGSYPTEFGIFNMATFDLVLKVIDAGGSMILWRSPLTWQVFQAILLKYAFAMAIHTVWISIQLHTMGLCWMKNIRIPESSRGKTFIPSRTSCLGFDKTQQRFLLLHNDMLTLWVFSPMSPSSQITLVDRNAIYGVGGNINTEPAAVVSRWSWSITAQSFWVFCFVGIFYFQKIKPLSLKLHRRQRNSTFLLLQ